jgi:hypothetical protein
MSPGLDAIIGLGFPMLRSMDARIKTVVRGL